MLAGAGPPPTGTAMSSSSAAPTAPASTPPTTFSCKLRPASSATALSSDWSWYPTLPAHSPRPCAASAAPAVWRIPYVEDLRIHRQSELAIWTPTEPDPPPPGRMRAPAPSTTTPNPELAAIGREIFTAARIAAGR